MNHVLDRPVWSALSTRQIASSLGGERARRWCSPTPRSSGGTVMSISLVPSARVCAYSCDTNTACHGFTVMGGNLCTLRSTLSNDVVTMQGVTSGVR